mgnify:CR=1 FL=1
MASAPQNLAPQGPTALVDQLGHFTPSLAGGASVTGGTITVGDNSALGTGAVTINGGELALGGTTGLVNNVTLLAGVLSGGSIPVAQVTLNTGTVSAAFGGVGVQAGRQPGGGLDEEAVVDRRGVGHGHCSASSLPASSTI